MSVYNVGPHGETTGKSQNAVSILTTATNSADLVTAGFSQLILMARMTAASASDLAVTVQPYEDDGTTLFAMALPTDQSVAAALTGGVSRLIQSYKLNGLSKVSVQIKNNNGGTQVATCVYALLD